MMTWTGDHASTELAALLGACTSQRPSFFAGALHVHHSRLLCVRRSGLLLENCTRIAHQPAPYRECSRPVECPKCRKSVQQSQEQSEKHSSESFPETLRRLRRLFLNFVGDIRQPVVDPVVGNPVRQDNDKI